MWGEGLDTEDYTWVSPGVPNDRKEHGDRALSQTLFLD